MKQLSLDFDDPRSSEKETSLVPASSLSEEDLDRARRAARMLAVLRAFPPLEPNLTPAEYMAQPQWLRRYLLPTEAYFFGRWWYWLKALATRRVPSAPIPRIPFQSNLPTYLEGRWSDSPKKHPGLQMLLDTVNFPHAYGLDLREKVLRLIDWVLSGLGSIRGEGLVKTDSEEADWYYRKFQIQRLYEYPADYMSCFSVSIVGGAGNRIGHFPTPGCLAEAMVDMLMCGDAEKVKTASVLDPAAGTGVLLLYASNYSLNLSAMDISATVCKLMEIGAWLYVPWLIFPAVFHAGGTLAPRGPDSIQTGNALE